MPITQDRMISVVNAAQNAQNLIQRLELISRDLMLTLLPELTSAKEKLANEQREIEADIMGKAAGALILIRNTLTESLSQLGAERTIIGIEAEHFRKVRDRNNKAKNYIKQMRMMEANANASERHFAETNASERSERAIADANRTETNNNVANNSTPFLPPPEALLAPDFPTGEIFSESVPQDAKRDEG